MSEYRFIGSRQVTGTAQGSWLALLGTLVFPLLVALDAEAHGRGVTDWLSPVGGNFDTRSLWSNGVPGPADTALFGQQGSPVIFDVLLSGTRTVGELRVTTQLPRFLPEAGVRQAGLVVNGPVLVQAPLAAPAALRMQGADLELGGLLSLGPTVQQSGALVLNGSDLLLRGANVGSFETASPAGFGSLTMESGATLVSGDPTRPIRVGIRGNGSLTLTGGSTLDLAGSPLSVGGNPNGSGSLTVGVGCTLRLNGGTLAVGATEGTTSGGGQGTALIDGTLVGPGTIVLGDIASGTLTLGPSSTIEAMEGIDFQLGVGQFGTGTLISKRPLALDSIAVGIESTGTLKLESTGGTSVFGHLNLGVGSTGNLVCTDADVDIGLLTMTSTTSTNVSDGFLHVDALSFGTSTNLASRSLKVTGPTGEATLPAVDLPPLVTFSITAETGATLTAPSFRSVANSAGILFVSGGASATIDGELTLSGSGTNGALIVGPNGGTITAATVTTSLSTKTEWRLPVTPSPITAESVTLVGPLVIINQGFAPTGEVDIPLVVANRFETAQLPSTTPVLLGYPSLVRKDATGLTLRVIDHIDGFAMPSSIEVSSGESISLPTVIVRDGEEYVVSGQATWSFSPAALLGQTGPSTFVGQLGGSGTATVTFGQSSLAIPVTVIPGEGVAVEAVSVNAAGTGFGNAHSAWDGPAQFPLPFGFGPRSLAGDGSAIAFSSQASNLNGDLALSTSDCFVRDLATASTLEWTGPTVGISGTSNAAPALSGDGRYLAMAVSGTVSGLAGSHAVVVDRWSGVPEIASLSATGALVTVDTLERTAVSDDGRFVAFTSTAGTVVAGDTNGVRDVFLRDRQLGTTVRASVGPGGQQFLGASTLADMTPDGRYVVVLRSMSGWRLAYRFDRLTGESVAVSAGLVDETPSVIVKDAQIADDGARVAFLALAAEPIVEGDQPLGAQVYLRDLAAATTTPAVVTELGEWPTAPIDAFAMSSDGRTYAVVTKATNLAEGTPSGLGRSWLVWRDSLANRNRFLSSGALGTFNQDVLPMLAMSDDGTRIGFVSRATNLVSLQGTIDTGTFNDVFLVTVTDSIEGDLDGDGVVGSLDLAALLGAWGGPGSADLDGDGTVGVTDLAILLGAWTS